MATELAEAPVETQPPKARPLWESLGEAAQQIVPPLVDTEVTEQPKETKEVTPPEPEDRSMVEKVAKPSKKDENWAQARESMRQQKEQLAQWEAKSKEWEQKEAQWKTETEQAQARMKELEEKLSKANPEDFTAKELKYQQELDAIRNELKLVALEKDPEFIARFEAPRTHLHATLQEIASTVGTSPEDFQRAFRLNQEEKLYEIREGLQPHMQRKWDAAILQIEQVNLQKELALKDKETLYRDITQKRQQEYQQTAQQRLQSQISMARQLAQEPFQKIQGLPDEWKSEIESTLVALAGGEGAERYTPESIMREFAASVVQRKVLESQNATLQSREEKIKDLEAKLKERDEFIQSRHGSMPANEVNGSVTKTPEKPGPIWERAQATVSGSNREFI